MSDYATAARKLAQREDAVTALEYALIATLIALAIVGTVQLLGTSLQSLFNQVAGAF
jgi:pilus assembly protein Flp/PilA